MPSPIPVHLQYSDEQKKQITDWFNQGLTQSQIADKLGCPRRTAMKLCQSVGLTRSTQEAAKLSIKSPWESNSATILIENQTPSCHYFKGTRLYVEQLLNDTN